MSLPSNNVVLELHGTGEKANKQTRVVGSVFLLLCVSVA